MIQHIFVVDVTEECGGFDYCLKYSCPPPHVHWMKILLGSTDTGHASVTCFGPMVGGMYVLPFGFELDHGSCFG